MLRVTTTGCVPSCIKQWFSSSQSRLSAPSISESSKEKVLQTIRGITLRANAEVLKVKKFFEYRASAIASISPATRNRVLFRGILAIGALALGALTLMRKEGVLKDQSGISKNLYIFSSPISIDLAKAPWFSIKTPLLALPASPSNTPLQYENTASFRGFFQQLEGIFSPFAKSISPFLIGSQLVPLPGLLSQRIVPVSAPTPQVVIPQAVDLSSPRLPPLLALLPRVSSSTSQPSVSPKIVPSRLPAAFGAEPLSELQLLEGREAHAPIWVDGKLEFDFSKMKALFIQGLKKANNSMALVLFHQKPALDHSVLFQDPKRAIVQSEQRVITSPREVAALESETVSPSSFSALLPRVSSSTSQLAVSPKIVPSRLPALPAAFGAEPLSELQLLEGREAHAPIWVDGKLEFDFSKMKALFIQGLKKANDSMALVLFHQKPALDQSVLFSKKKA